MTRLSGHHVQRQNMRAGLSEHVAVAAVTPAPWPAGVLDDPVPPSWAGALANAAAALKR